MSHPYNQGMIVYGEMLEERTNGKFSIEVYPDASWAPSGKSSKASRWEPST